MWLPYTDTVVVVRSNPEESTLGQAVLHKGSTPARSSGSTDEATRLQPLQGAFCQPFCKQAQAPDKHGTKSPTAPTHLKAYRMIEQYGCNVHSLMRMNRESAAHAALASRPCTWIAENVTC